MAFRKATKKQVRLRAAIYGPSGSGKTFSALRIASGLGDRIAVIDTEHGSAERYADRFAFDVCRPENLTIDGYLAAFRDAAREGYPVLVIDSLSHAWQELLAEVDKLAATKYRGNTWSAWSEGTPKQRRLVDAILAYPGHVIATMRADTEWVQEQDGRGKTKPVKVGLKPQQGKGIEYEFDLLISLSLDHTANVEKDRTGKFQDRLIERPGEEFGRELAAWLSEGEPLSDAPAPQTASRGKHLAGANAEEEMPIPTGRADWRRWTEPPKEQKDAGEWYVAAVKGLLHHCGAKGKRQANALLAWLLPDDGIDVDLALADGESAAYVWRHLIDRSNAGVPFTRMLGEAVAATQPQAQTAA